MCKNQQENLMNTKAKIIYTITDEAPALATQSLLPTGRLAIADLDLDDGKFHSNNDGVFHFGFDREKLRKSFTEAGFDNIQDISAAEIEKETLNNEIRQFTVFLMVGKKV